MTKMPPPNASEDAEITEVPHDGLTYPPERKPHQRPGREGGRRDTNRKARHEALQRAALELFLAHGVENATVDAIAQKAGTAKGNFYRYAADKRELVASLIAPVFEFFKEAFEECEKAVSAATTQSELMQAYLKLALQLFNAVLEQPEVVRLYLQECRAPDVGAREPIAQFERWIAEHTVLLTRLACERHLVRALAPEVMGLAIIGAVERLVIAYLREGSFEKPHEIIRQFVTLMMGGLAASPMP